jgi:general secretion pathway protein B
MSYILDALRRADAERERGALPGLHTQPFAPSALDAEPQRRAPVWVWAALGLLVALAAVLAWKLLAGGDGRGGDARTAMGTPAAPGTAAGTTTAVPAPPSSSAAPQPSAPAAPPVAAVELPMPAPPAKPPAPRAPAREAARPETRAAAARAEPAEAAANPSPRGPAANARAAAPAAAPAASSSSGADRIFRVAELPEDVRRGLPALPIGGATYSQNPASRMLIINGQVFREGDTLAPELTLELIRLKSAVLRFRGYRYEVGY